LDPHQRHSLLVERREPDHLHPSPELAGEDWLCEWNWDGKHRLASRYEGYFFALLNAEAVAAINDLYGHELRLWLNLYLPSVKLLRKVRVGSKVRRVYDGPRTPFERVKACSQADREKVARLEKLRKSLDPFQLGKISVNPPREAFAVIISLSLRMPGHTPATRFVHDGVATRLAVEFDYRHRAAIPHQK
jgi:hypothetical protein